MMKKMMAILAALALLIAGAVCCAEQLPSVELPRQIDAKVTVAQSAEMKESLAIRLLAQTEAADAVLKDVQAFVKTEKIAAFFGEETIAAAAEYLPENYVTDNLMLVELYDLKAENYSPDYGEVDAVFEFAVQYPDDAILLGMIGVTNDAADAEASDELVWFPVPATASEGVVSLSISQELMERISGGEEAIFILLQDQQ